MASGKTTFGRAAAELLGWNFVDLDEQIASRYGTPAELFAARGEAGFRALESEMLDEALDTEGNTVIALGGGTILREENLHRIRAKAILIWLDTAFDIILSELDNADRPIVRGKSAEAIRTLYETRRPLYAAAADLVFPIASTDYGQVVNDLADLLRTL